MGEQYPPENRRISDAKSAGSRRRPAVPEQDLRDRSRFGVEAAFPRNPKKLLEALRTSPPDLLVLDLNSRRFEPLELLRTVRSDEALGTYPPSASSRTCRGTSRWPPAGLDATA